MRVHTGTLQGRRHYQEDRLLVDTGRLLFCISDGMGGHPNGDLAAQCVVDTVRKHTYTDEFCDELHEAFLAANKECVTANDYRGATATAAILRGDTLFITHVGDTRVQVYNTITKELKQVTKDHGYLHYLDNFIGDMAKSDKLTHKLVVGDIVLLTTDGIHDTLSKVPGMFAEFIQKSIDQELVNPAEFLAQRAVDAGSSDNCSAIVIVTEDEDF